jgi:hypothetical protein
MAIYDEKFVSKPCLQVVSYKHDGDAQFDVR